VLLCDAVCCRLLQIVAQSLCSYTLCVVTRIWMVHATHMNESWYTYKCVVLHARAQLLQIFGHVHLHVIKLEPSKLQDFQISKSKPLALAHMHTLKHTRVCIHMHTYIRMAHAPARALANIRTQKNKHTNTHARTRTHITRTHAYTHTHTH